MRKRKASDASNGSDATTISLTSTREPTPTENDEYEVEKILAQAIDPDYKTGKVKFYLVEWKGYPLSEATWEPEDNIIGQTVLQTWAETHRLQEDGKLEPFDTDAWADEKDFQKEEKERRKKRRRAKRKRLGYSVTPITSDAEEDDQERNKTDDTDLSDDVPLRHRKRIARLKISDDEDTEMPDADQKEDDGAELSSDEGVRSKEVSPRRHTIHPTVESNDTNNATDKEDARHATSHKKGKSKQKLAETHPKKLKKGIARPVSRSVSTTSKDDTIERTYLKPRTQSVSTSIDVQEKPEGSSRSSSTMEPRGRTGYMGTANRAIATQATSSRGRGRPRIDMKTSNLQNLKSMKTTLKNLEKASSKNSTNLTGSIGFAAPVKAKAERSLQAAIINGNEMPGVFRNMARQYTVQKAGRNIADRAPEIALSELVSPADFRFRKKKDLAKKASDYLPQKRNKEPEEPANEPFDNVSCNDDVIPSFEEPEQMEDPKQSKESEETVVKTTKQENEKEKEKEKELKKRMGQLAAENQAAEAEISRRTAAEGQGPQGKRVSFGIGQPAVLNIRTDQPVSRTLSAGSPASILTPVFERPPPTGPRNSLPDIPPLAISEPKVPQRRIPLSAYAARHRGQEAPDEVPSKKRKIMAYFGESKSQSATFIFGPLKDGSVNPWRKTLAELDSMTFKYFCIAGDIQNAVTFLSPIVIERGCVQTEDGMRPTLEGIANHLRHKIGGLVCAHNGVNLLIFPSRLKEWDFLKTPAITDESMPLYFMAFQASIDLASVSYEAVDQALMLAIDQDRLSLEVYHHQLLGLHYQRFLPVPSKGGKSDLFFVLFPTITSPFAKAVLSWLRECNPECTILHSLEPGAFNKFRQASKDDFGAFLIHKTMLPFIRILPKFLSLLMNGRNTFWMIDEAALNGKFIARLFPAGKAIMLTPTFLRFHPKKALEILEWFRKKESNSNGTWKLVGPCKMTEFLEDLARSKCNAYEALKKSSNSDITALAKSKGLSYKSRSAQASLAQRVRAMIDKFENCESIIPWYKMALPGEHACPVVYTDESIEPDDEKKLVNWFGEWTMTHLHMFRRFVVIGTDTSTSPEWLHENETLAKMSTSKPKHNPSAPSSPDISRKSSLIEPGSALLTPTPTASKRIGFNNTFSLVDETANVRKSSIVEEVLAKSTSIPPETPTEPPYSPTLTATPPADQTPAQPPSKTVTDKSINKDKDATVLAFIADTGLTVKEATSYLDLTNRDLGAALTIFHADQAAKEAKEGTPIPKYAGLQEQELNRSARESRASTLETGEIPSRPSSVAGIVETEDGTRIVPASKRESGSMRPERAVRPGFIPKEDGELWKRRAVSAGAGATPGGKENSKPGESSGGVTSAPTFQGFSLGKLPSNKSVNGAAAGKSIMSPGEGVSPFQTSLPSPFGPGAATSAAPDTPGSVANPASPFITAKYQEKAQHANQTTSTPKHAAAHAHQADVKGMQGCEMTMHWYNEQRTQGKAWEHIYVVNWEDAARFLEMPQAHHVHVPNNTLQDSMDARIAT